MNSTGELAGSGLAHPLLEAGRQAGNSQSWKARGILYQTVNRLPVANQVILGSWMVDIRQEGCGQISSPEETHSTPEKVLPLCTRETKQPRQGRR